MDVEAGAARARVLADELGIGARRERRRDERDDERDPDRPARLAGDLPDARVDAAAEDVADDEEQQQARRDRAAQPAALGTLGDRTGADRDVRLARSAARHRPLLPRPAENDVSKSAMRSTATSTGTRSSLRSGTDGSLEGAHHRAMPRLRRIHALRTAARPHRSTRSARASWLAVLAAAGALVASAAPATAANVDDGCWTGAYPWTFDDRDKAPTCRVTPGGIKDRTWSDDAEQKDQPLIEQEKESLVFRKLARGSWPLRNSLGTAFAEIKQLSPDLPRGKRRRITNRITDETFDIHGMTLRVKGEVCASFASAWRYIHVRVSITVKNRPDASEALSFGGLIARSALDLPARLQAIRPGTRVKEPRAKTGCGRRRRLTTARDMAPPQTVKQFVDFGPGRNPTYVSSRKEAQPEGEPLDNYYNAAFGQAALAVSTTAVQGGGYVRVIVPLSATFEELDHFDYLDPNHGCDSVDGVRWSYGRIAFPKDERTKDERTKNPLPTEVWGWLPRHMYLITDPYPCPKAANGPADDKDVQSHDADTDIQVADPPGPAPVTLRDGVQMLLDSAGQVWAKTTIGGDWILEAPPGHAAIAAGGGGLQMLVDGAGQVWAKNHVGNGGWTLETPTGPIPAIAAGDDGLQMLRDSAGQVWAKNFIGNGGWTLETPTGHTPAIAAGDDGLQMLLDSAGQVWAKNHIASGGWTLESPAGHRAIAAGDGGLQMLLDGAGQVWAKNHIGNGGWILETPAGHRSIAAGDGGLQMLLDGAGQVWAKNHIGNGGWIRESGPGFVAIEAGGDGLRMAMTGEGEVWAKRNQGYGGWVREANGGIAAIAAG